MPDARGGPSAVVEIRTTIDSHEKAESVARQLVESRLAACGQIDGPITSVYRWQGRIETTREHRLTLKTTRGRSLACLEMLRSLHPYEVPEVLMTEVEASDAYGTWVEESVRP